MKNISNRDKKLLLLLLIVAVLGLPYFLFVQPTMEKNANLEAEIKALTDEKAVLEQHTANVPFYQEEMATIALEETLVYNRFPAELPQEGTLLFINETENYIPIKLQNVSFGEVTSAPIAGLSSPEISADGQTADEVLEAADAAGDEIFGADEDAATAGIGEPAAQDVAAAGGLSGAYTVTQFSYRAGYEEFKEFLEYIRKYQNRMVIAGIDATYGEDTEEVSGSFSLIQYALTGAGRKPAVVMKPDIPQGTENIFLSAAGLYTGVGETPSEADYFIMLSRPDAARDAKIVGKNGDPAETSYLTSDTNDEEEITVTFVGEAGAYTAAYNIDGEEFAGESMVFAKEGPIYLEIISSPRSGEEDAVAALVNIVNHTDQPVYVTTLEDDGAEPRVTMGESTGTVIVNQE